MVTQIDLSELGLSKNQSKAYGILVEHGSITSTEISSLSGVPYGRIYDVLGKLIEKGLVKIIPGKTKIFSATSPADLLKIVEEKESSLKKTKENIESLQKFYESTNKEAVSIGVGDKGFWKLAKEMKKPVKYSYSVRWNFKEREGNVEKFKRDKKSGIIQNNLVHITDENRGEIQKLIKIGLPVKKFQNEGVAMAIHDDEEVLIGLIKSNTTLLIRNKAFAKIMKKMFEETYKNAEEIR